MLLLRNYILFTVVLALVLISLFAYVLFHSYYSVMEFDISQIRACDSLLRSGAYAEFPTVRLLGEKGFIAVLDEHYRLLYASGNYIASDLTEKEYLLLTQRYFDGYSVKQYGFESSSGETFTLLLFQPQESGNPVSTKLENAISDTGLIFLVIYCAMITGFILWLKRKITIPLQLLCRQLDRFEVGCEAAPLLPWAKGYLQLFPQLCRRLL